MALSPAQTMVVTFLEDNSEEAVLVGVEVLSSEELEEEEDGVVRFAGRKSSGLGGLENAEVGLS